MVSTVPPSLYFPGINFYLSFYTEGDSSASLNYVNSTFPRGTVYSFSRALATTFNNIVYFNGGFQTTNILASGTISATNIGIGITNPSTSSFEILRNVTTTSDLINMRYDTNNGLRFQQAFVSTNDVKYNIIQKHNNVDTNTMTYYRGNIGTGTTASLVTANTTTLHLYNVNNSRVLLDTTTTDTSALEFRRGTEFDIQNKFRFINDTDSTLKLQYQNNQQAYTDNVAQLMWVMPNVTTGLLSVKMWKDTEFVGNIGIGALPSTVATTKLNITGDDAISGNLGIGKLPSATYKLDVKGSINATSIFVSGSAISGSRWSLIPSTTNTFYNTGNVGIGASTTSDVDDNTMFAIPTARLYVRGGESAGGTCDVVIRGSVPGQNNGKARLWLAGDASHTSTKMVILL